MMTSELQLEGKSQPGVKAGYCVAAAVRQGFKHTVDSQHQQVNVQSLTFGMVKRYPHVGIGCVSDKQHVYIYYLGLCQFDDVRCLQGAAHEPVFDN